MCGTGSGGGREVGFGSGVRGCGSRAAWPLRVGSRAGAAGCRGTRVGRPVSVRDGAGDRGAVRCLVAADERAGAAARKTAVSWWRARACLAAPGGVPDRHELLGWPRRRAPRAEVQREHEAAIVWLVTELELADSEVRVLTERECRRIERDDGRRYSVEVGDRQRRWPDVVIQSERGGRAIEIEFAPKGSDRLRRIVVAYEVSDYDQALFLVKSVALGQRIQSLVPRPLALHGGHVAPPKVRVAAWPGLTPDERERLDAALGQRA
jgi:hypothetical protein